MDFPYSPRSPATPPNIYDQLSPGASPIGRVDQPFYSPNGSPTAPISPGLVQMKIDRGEPLTAAETRVAYSMANLSRPMSPGYSSLQGSPTRYSPRSPGASLIDRVDQPFYSPERSPVYLPGDPLGASPTAPISPGLVQMKMDRGERLTAAEAQVANSMAYQASVYRPGSPSGSPRARLSVSPVRPLLTSPGGSPIRPSAVSPIRGRPSMSIQNTNQPSADGPGDVATQWFAEHQPVEVINGIKIYDAEGVPYLSDPKQTDKERVYDFYRQDGDRLDHIFLWKARATIDTLRAAEIADPGLSPTIEMNLTILAQIYGYIFRAFDNYRQETEGRGLGYYNVIEQLVKHTSTTDFNLYDFTLGYLNFGESGGVYDFINEQIIPMAKQVYMQLGFEKSYFGYVNPQNPYVMAKKGEVPLRPDTFEAFAFFDRAPPKYTAAQQAVSSWHGPSIEGCHDRRLKPIFTIGGWSKKDLVAAIKSSGLWKDVSQLKKAGRYQRSQLKGIAFADVGMKSGNRAANEFNRNEVLPGFRKNAYMSHCYYESVYRKIFSTLDFINWPLLCKLNAVSLEGIRAIAVEHYDANPGQVEKASVSEICAFVTEQSHKRLELTENLALTLAKEATAAQAGFVHRPGSRWVQPPTMRMMAGMSPEAPTNDYAIYLKIKAYCEDDNVTKDNLIGFAEALRVRDLLPPDLESYTKSDLCDRLIDVLLPRAEKYESILFDCSDPAIKVRHIINAANLMELGNIFPKDVSRLTKERACEIITNYIALLQEARALKLAPGADEGQRRTMALGGLGYGFSGNGTQRVSPSRSVQNSNMSPPGLL